ncbi:hypothetical protein ACFFUT_08565 [Pseudohalocynthiibacter aestuariivivens]|uniref:Uncharacterized protein n=1 Tax=Pseudohalocynthiibacter aestuariivivens TaxID=1591409 RepID=A0ABV5JED7_9RHOB|nr:hypothetical protein [Pseudohalocynthiibacter aestuariivivens]MBS9718490.1 hypothetical protein [Pseudohalocynthiibacter aestuariivivens]
MPRFTDEEYEDLVTRLENSHEELVGKNFEMSELYGDAWTKVSKTQMGIKLSAEISDRRDGRIDRLVKVEEEIKAPYHILYRIV